jgi:hypothetical protein
MCTAQGEDSRSATSSPRLQQSALRINLNIDGTPIVSKSHTHPSHSTTLPEQENYQVRLWGHVSLGHEHRWNTCSSTGTRWTPWHHMNTLRMWLSKSLIIRQLRYLIDNLVIFHHQLGSENPHQLPQSVWESIALTHLCVAKMHSLYFCQFHLYQRSCQMRWVWNYSRVWWVSVWFRRCRCDINIQ